MASGHRPPTPALNFGGAYVNTTHAKVGDKGTSLPPAPSGTVWSAGMSYEVSWTIEAGPSPWAAPSFYTVVGCHCRSFLMELHSNLAVIAVTPIL